MKNKPKDGVQFVLPLADTEARSARQTVVAGRFKSSNTHLDAVSRRLAGSGVFASRPNKNK